jgi:nucleoside-diphosphate-sugar epimerase
MKIFVTGGTGFIGSHFLKAAMAAGHEITALRFGGLNPPIQLPGDPVWLDGKLDDDWSRELSQCAALVHLAAAGVSPLKVSWEEYFEVNVQQSLNLWRRAAKAGVKRLIICGSCFEYGKSGERYEFIPVDAPLEPTSAYAASKAAATMAALAFSMEESIELLVLRPFHVFGEEGEAGTRFWPSLRKAAQEGEDFAMTMGEQVRNFVPVQIVADTFVAALTRSDLQAGKPRIENVGTGKPQTLRAFAEFWWRQWNAKGRLKIGALPYRDNEVMRYVPEIKN